MTDADMTRALAERVMGWNIEPPDYIDQAGWLWRWKGDRIQQPWRPLQSMDDAWMVVERMRDMWTAATERSSGVRDDFEHPFDDTYFFDLLRRNADRRWPWAFLYVTPHAICVAALCCVGVEVEYGS